MTKKKMMRGKNTVSPEQLNIGLDLLSMPSVNGNSSGSSSSRAPSQNATLPLSCQDSTSAATSATTKPVSGVLQPLDAFQLDLRYSVFDWNTNKMCFLTKSSPLKLQHHRKYASSFTHNKSKLRWWLLSCYLAHPNSDDPWRANLSVEIRAASHSSCAPAPARRLAWMPAVRHNRTPGSVFSSFLILVAVSFGYLKQCLWVLWWNY